MSQCPTVVKRVQLRHDISANWTTANPLLLQGEIGIETDTNRMKLGDGISRWQQLPYFPPDTGTSSVFDGGTPSSDYGIVPSTINCGGVT